MKHQAEPSYRHDQAEHTAVLWVNLGTPDAATAPALRRYLAEFLSDPRVVEIPRLVWLPILHGIILRLRPAKSAAKYATVWTEQGSPLAVWTRAQAHRLAEAFAQAGRGALRVLPAMRYGQPSVARQLDALKAEGATRVLILPAYPQYSATTTASVFDAVYAWAGRQRRLPELRFVNQYHDDPAYIEALARRLEAHWAEHGRPDRLVLSFHGVPERTLTLGDPYHCQCLKTARLLGERLGLPPEQLLTTFQSRFGKAKWLEPYTEPTLVALGQQGIGRVDVFCPGFVADCLETLEEIAQEARHAFLEAGGKVFHHVPCLNADPAWIEALAGIASRHLQGWPDGPAPEPAERAARCTRALARGAKA
ncbi:ferrochelatase [Aquariibacter albus]|uniref:Ferrochelatase n=1 Tax=Aquariibacter albus TaxID=2759899 RepID=A0A839HIF1_9BURK|nr:ferrochelatase [Aquariibacter albus]MBB1161256.1 ferrochelatase [Aquariibacter albus]